MKTIKNKIVSIMIKEKLKKQEKQYNLAIISAYALYLRFVDRKISFTDFEKKVLNDFNFLLMEEKN